MTSEQAVQAAHDTIVDKGTRAMRWLLQGPEGWAKAPRAAIRPEHVSSALLIGLAAPDSMNSRWIDTQRTLCLTLVNVLVQDLEQWAAENDRLDLFATVAELVEEAVLASDEP